MGSIPNFSFLPFHTGKGIKERRVLFNFREIFHLFRGLRVNHLILNSTELVEIKVASTILFGFTHNRSYSFYIVHH